MTNSKNKFHFRNISEFFLRFLNLVNKRTSNLADVAIRAPPKVKPLVEIIKAR